jgi:multiple sugar transport system substrate-binding protein
MTGAYQAWQYGSAGYLQDLGPLMSNTSLTNPDYDVSDFIPNVLAGDKWDLVPGHPVGTGEQLAIPLAFEIYPLEYNVKAFEKAHITSPPKTWQELYNDAVKLNGWNGPGSYGIAVRGIRLWGTIHPDYESGLMSWGGQDFSIENGKLNCELNSPQAIAFTQLWAKMVKDAGPPGWTTYDWNNVCDDLGAGKAAMIYDADIAAFFENQQGASKEAGNIAWAMPPAGPNGDVKSNEWIWSVAMNSYSTHKLASWLFLQYFTGKDFQLWGALNSDLVNPVRTSIWQNADFMKMLGNQKDYYTTFEQLIPNAKIGFTPQPMFFQVTTDWAATLQMIVAGNVSAQDGMTALAKQIDQETASIQVK